MGRDWNPSPLQRRANVSHVTIKSRLFQVDGKLSHFCLLKRKRDTRVELGIGYIIQNKYF